MTLYADAVAEEYVCETCGPSFDSFAVYYDEDGWNVDVRSGCYGGVNLTTDRAGVIRWLEDNVNAWEAFSPDSIREIIEAVKRA